MCYLEHLTVSDINGGLVNVAFSDGSLLDGFKHRIESGHPITIPDNIKRFFITPEEATYLSIINNIWRDRHIAIPNENASLNLTSFQHILDKFYYKEVFDHIFVNLKMKRESFLQLTIEVDFGPYLSYK